MKNNLPRATYFSIAGMSYDMLHDTQHWPDKYQTQQTWTYLLTNKIYLGGVDFLHSCSGVGSRGVVGYWVLHTSHTTADYTDWLQIAAGGSWGGGGGHRQRSGGDGAAQGGVHRLAGGSHGGGRCLSDHARLCRGDGLTKFGMKLHNLEEPQKVLGKTSNRFDFPSQGQLPLNMGSLVMQPMDILI